MFLSDILVAWTKRLFELTKYLLEKSKKRNYAIVQKYIYLLTFHLFIFILHWGNFLNKLIIIIMRFGLDDRSQ